MTGDWGVMFRYNDDACYAVCVDCAWIGEPAERQSEAYAELDSHLRSPAHLTPARTARPAGPDPPPLRCDTCGESPPFGGAHHYLDASGHDRIACHATHLCLARHQTLTTAERREIAEYRAERRQQERHRGVAGRTHCGSWRLRPPTYPGWRQRIVCSLTAAHEPPHRTPEGWTWWSDGDAQPPTDPPNA